MKSIYIPFNKRVKPGQFLMITIPGVDEIPMSVSGIYENEISFTFKVVGDATERLFNMVEGDILGIRGPLGRGFDLKGEKILFSAGGTGISAIFPAVKKAKEEDKEVIGVIGARSKNELFFVDKLKKFGKIIVVTDDGSYGLKGLVSDVTNKIIDDEKPDLVITCGPEIMMKKILDFCLKRGIDFQASVERYMKCGIGICGHCCIGEGLRVCKEGPVFSGEELKNCRDFGVYKRDSSGRRVCIKNG